MIKLLKQGLLILALLSFVILYFASSTQANSHFDALSKSTKQDLELIQRLVNNPCLLDANYLECYTGEKASTTTAPVSKSLHSTAPAYRICWQDTSGQLVRYKLEQSKANINQYLATFQCVFCQQEDVRIEDVDKILNEDSKDGYDEDGHLAQIYSFDLDYQSDPNKQYDPNRQNQQNKLHTKVFVYQETHLINVSRILVQYSGPPLPPPSIADIKEANDFRRNNAFDHHQLGNHLQANKLLQAHLKAHPDDAEAHLKLAESYKAQSCINESIAEYKTALSYCDDNSDLRNQCLAGLHELKVDIPPPVNTSPPSATQPLFQERININPTTSNAPIFSPSNNGPKNLDVGF